MRIYKLILLAVVVCTGLAACQKELSFDYGDVSAGTFKKDAAGNCQPANINGIFQADSVLNSSHFADVQVNVTNPGTFNIQSDTVNGFWFSKTDVVVMGLNSIRLYATGKPVTAGTSTFTVKFGSSTCSFTVTVLPSGSGGTAVFTLGGTPGACTGASTSGPFISGVPLTTANNLIIQVNVTTPGTYLITAATTKGFSFSGAGVFTITGLQNVTLNGSGTPSSAGSAPIVITNFASACTFSVTVLAGTGGGGTGNSQYYFSFTDGTNNIAADTTGVVALSINNAGLVMLSVSAFSVTGDSSFSVAVTTTGNPQTGVTYKTSNIGLPIAVFAGLSTTNGQVYQADVSTQAQNINIKFDVIDTVNKIVSGTFSGTVKKLSGTGTITNGKFRALLQ